MSVERVRQLLADATPGPWRWSPDGDQWNDAAWARRMNSATLGGKKNPSRRPFQIEGADHDMGSIYSDEAVILEAYGAYSGEPSLGVRPADAELIAASRSLLPALLNLYDAAREYADWDSPDEGDYDGPDPYERLVAALAVVEEEAGRL